MAEAIQDKNRDDFSLAVSTFNQVIPFTKVKTTLVVRVKELYLPEDSSNFVQNADEVDFTGAQEDNEGVKAAEEE